MLRFCRKIIILHLSLMFVPCKLDVVEMTNNMHSLYHSFIPYTDSYMFRQ
jgi:putative effector of murein hydrolase LrgA (UPF0299 family)